MRLVQTLILLLFTVNLAAQTILPTPESVVFNEGSFLFPKVVRVSIDDKEGLIVPYLKDVVLPAVNSDLQRVQKARRADIDFAVDDSFEDEAYALKITGRQIQIRASGHAGFFNAIQSMYQMLLQSPSRQLRCLTIKDSPRHKMRIFMLDSGRQFQQLSTIKKYLDMMAMLKMNTFHWHLTEGLGWRLEIKKYPELVQKGAFVNDAPEGHGYYTQEDVKEIIRYATQRNITVIPEINMPGHSEAAIIAYPELSCFGDTVHLKEGQGFSHNILCAGKPSTMQFLKDVLDEVSELFPSQYIHVGGDEAPKDNWDKCPDCQGLIERENLKSSGELQLYFSAQIAEYLKSKDKKAIFWEDMLYHDGVKLPDNVVVQWWNWRGHKDTGFREAIKRGHEVICGTNYYNYLNFPVSPWRGYEANRTFDIVDIYERNPSMNRDENPLVLGMSAALWTDYNLTESMLDERIFPRIFALAEQMWYKGDTIPFDDFYKKVQNSRDHFERMGYRFGPGLKSEVPLDNKAK